MTTTTRNAPTVLLREIAIELGGLFELAEGYARRFDMQVVTGWTGEPAVSEADAGELVRRVREIRDEQSRKERAYANYTEQRARDREAAGSTAYAKAAKEGAGRDLEATKAAADSVSIGEGVRVLASGSTRGTAREAREQALQEFDRKNKITPFEKFEVR
ncbi:MAG TPA: hypothetical protein VMN39_00400 [Longimicrobiaceae bacterium]|nr:hypothetical protein [Longimicrobiaceae bacterium]